MLQPELQMVTVDGESHAQNPGWQKHYSDKKIIAGNA